MDSDTDTDGETINTESEMSEDDSEIEDNDEDGDGYNSMDDFIVPDEEGNTSEEDADGAEGHADGTNTDDDDDEDDEDYYPDEDTEDTEDDERLPISLQALGRSYRIGPPACERLSHMIRAMQTNASNKITTRKRKRIPHYTREENDYYHKMSPEEQTAMEVLEKTVMVKEDGQPSSNLSMPLRFRLLKSEADLLTKRLLLSKLDNINHMSGNEGDYHKMLNWLQSAMRLPLGRITKLPVQREAGVPAIRSFLETTREALDTAVYGHKDSKEQVMRILAQWISNPQSRGHCIGIQGPMGVGKSSIVKEGIAKALNLPFSYIALGGATDGAFLEGHSITYEGSTHGKIAEVLIKAGCMNPVIFFDELDKVSETAKGEEVANILVHLTDPAQNEHFNDRFFTEIDLDLSKALMVFAYNDESKINPILLDRMTIIRVNGYDNADKLTIARKHLLPSILEQHGIQEGRINFTDEIIKTIIERVPDEKGVRNLRRGLESIVSWFNMLQYLPDDEFDVSIQPVYEITEAFVRKYLKKQTQTTEHHNSMYL